MGWGCPGVHSRPGRVSNTEKGARRHLSDVPSPPPHPCHNTSLPKPLPFQATELPSAQKARDPREGWTESKGSRGRSVSSPSNARRKDGTHPEQTRAKVPLLDGPRANRPSAPDTPASSVPGRGLPSSLGAKRELRRGCAQGSHARQSRPPDAPPLLGRAPELPARGARGHIGGGARLGRPCCGPRSVCVQAPLPRARPLRAEPGGGPDLPSEVPERKTAQCSAPAEVPKNLCAWRMRCGARSHRQRVTPTW